MTDPIVYIDRSEIREGKIDDVRVAIRGLVAFIESNVPSAISYGIYLDEAQNRMTVVQVHPNSQSLEFHMKVGAPAFAEFKDLIRLSAIDIYGEPSDRLRQQLADKARMLGNGFLSVHRLESGFARFTTG